MRDLWVGRGLRGSGEGSVGRSGLRGSGRGYGGRVGRPCKNCSEVHFFF